MFLLTLYEGQDLLVLLFGLTLLHQVDLVLQDEDVLQLHDLDGRQVLRRLRLRTRLISRCRVGGERQQKSDGTSLEFSSVQVISHISFSVFQ